jgi:hypothetical protein
VLEWTSKQIPKVTIPNRRVVRDFNARTGQANEKGKQSDGETVRNYCPVCKAHLQIVPGVRKNILLGNERHGRLTDRGARIQSDNSGHGEYKDRDHQRATDHHHGHDQSKQQGAMI